MTSRSVLASYLPDDYNPEEPIQIGRFANITVRAEPVTLLDVQFIIYGFSDRPSDSNLISKKIKSSYFEQRN